MLEFEAWRDKIKEHAPKYPGKELAMAAPCVSLVEESAIYKQVVPSAEGIFLRKLPHNNHNSRTGQIIHRIRIIINQGIITEIIPKPIDETSVWQSLMTTCTMKNL